MIAFSIGQLEKTLHCHSSWWLTSGLNAGLTLLLLTNTRDTIKRFVKRHCPIIPVPSCS